MKIIFPFPIDKMKIIWYNISIVKDMEKSLKPDWRKKIMKEKFTDVFNKNVEKMERAKAMYEIAVKQGNKDLARKYRKEYIELKSEIDVYALQIIM